MVTDRQCIQSDFAVFVSNTCMSDSPTDGFLTQRARRSYEKFDAPHDLAERKEPLLVSEMSCAARKPYRQRLLPSNERLLKHYYVLARRGVWHV